MFDLDHIVHYTKDPKRSVTEMGELGFHAAEGGEHPNWGTYNSLCHFGLSYIEFLGIQDQEQAQNVTDNPLVQRIVEDAGFGEGLSQIALRSDNIEQTAQRLQKKNLQLKGPIPGKRTRKDGTVIEWQLLFPHKDQYGGPPLPFFIQWNDSDEKRRADLTQQQAIGGHDVSLSYIGFSVRNLEERVVEWCHWFDLEPGECFEDGDLGATCQYLKLNGARLLFCEPCSAGPAMQTLKTRGESPFLIAISNTNITKDIQQMGTIYRFQS